MNNKSEILPENVFAPNSVIEKEIVKQIAKASGKMSAQVSTNGGPLVPKLAISKPFTKVELVELKDKLINTGLFQGQPDGDFIEEDENEYSILLQWVGKQNRGDEWLLSVDQDGEIYVGLDM